MPKSRLVSREESDMSVTSISSSAEKSAKSEIVELSKYKETRQIAESITNSTVAQKIGIKIEEITKNRNGVSAVFKEIFEKYFASYEDEKGASGLYELILKEIEKPLIEECLKITQGNQIRASEILGLNRNTLRKKIKDLGVKIHPKKGNHKS